MASPTDQLTTRDVLGFPVVPPPWATRVVNAVRRRLLGAHRQAAPPSIRVLEGLFGLFDNRVLGVLVELEVPDRLDRPRSVDDLAAELECDTDALGRFLRYAAGRGFVGFDRRGRVVPTPVTRVLRRDDPNSWRGWVEFAGSDWFWEVWRKLDSSVRGSQVAMEAATGRDFFSFVNSVRPDAGDAFNRAMAAGATVQALALERALDWSGVRTVCDVGGGTGATLEYLLRRQLSLEGVLFDLPDVVADARPALRHGALAGRTRLVGGSFFDQVPSGFDRYLLLAIVHDWDDERAAQLLTRVREAMTSGSRAMVVEGVLADRPRGDFTEASDLLMCVVATGRERTRREFSDLFAASGLRPVREHRLATGFSAFELAR